MDVHRKGAPENIILQLAETLPRGSMTLDMGSGERRNALYLARQGIKVEAWDKNAKEIDTLKAMAAKENLEIHAEVCDMRDFRIGYNNRDAISLHRVQELVTELYLAEGKKREKHWKAVAGHLEKLGVRQPHLDHFIEQDNPELVANLVKSLMTSS